MSNSCYSCGMPLTGENLQGNYCQFCTNEKGELHPKDVILSGVAQWLAGWAPEGKDANFKKRAEYYLKAMPEWAD